MSSPRIDVWEHPGPHLVPLTVATEAVPVHRLECTLATAAELVEVLGTLNVLKREREPSLDVSIKKT